MSKKWTDEEFQFLKFAYPNKDFTIEEIAKALGRSTSRIRAVASKLGIQRYVEKLPDGFKRCTKCDTILPSDFFPSHLRTKDKLNSWCKVCINSYRQSIKQERSCSERSCSESKLCKGCNKSQPLTMFSKNKNMKDGHLNYCKDCMNEKERITRIRGGY